MSIYFIFQMQWKCLTKITHDCVGNSWEAVGKKSQLLELTLTTLPNWKVSREKGWGLAKSTL